MVHSLFLSILNSLLVNFSSIRMLLESSWNFTSFGGSFVQFRVVLTKLWAFEGMLSFCNRFLDNNLLLQISRSTLIRSSSPTYSWKAIEIALLLVVVLLSFELYWESYDCLKVGWVLRSWLKMAIYFCTFWGQLWSNLFDLHIFGMLLKLCSIWW